MKYISSFLLFIFLVSDAQAVAKPHVVSFGKVTPVKWIVGSDQMKILNLKVRALYVDARLKEYTIGSPHDVTDRLFVVRRAFRLNDNLPEESAAQPRWHWERGGWLLVDKVTGRVSQINLPDFDPFYSAANWYRDYIAYCGVSDDGKKLYAVVVQLGRRKPVLKKLLGEAAGEDARFRMPRPAVAARAHPCKLSAGAGADTYVFRERPRCGHGERRGGRGSIGVAHRRHIRHTHQNKPVISRSHANA